jgi:hypothetical protein
MDQIQWSGHAEEVKGEEDIIRRGLSKLQPMAITNMHVAYSSASNQLYSNKQRWPLHVLFVSFLRPKSIKKVY